MLCYAIFDQSPTKWSLLMEDIALVVFGGLAVLMLSFLVTWLVVIVLSIILLPTYLLGVLHPAIRKIALGLQNEFAHLKSIVSNRPIIIGRKERGVMKQAKILSIEDQLKKIPIVLADSDLNVGNVTDVVIHPTEGTVIG
jgi:hypothetical protein